MKWIVLLFFGGMGLPLLVGSGVQGLQGYALYRDGVSVQGRVVENRSRRMGDRQYERIEYFPVVEFTSAGEKRHRFVGDEPRDAKIEIGSTISILYDPKDPSTAKIADRENFELFWQIPLVMGVWGVLILAVGIGVFFMIRSAEKTKRPEFGPGILESKGPGSNKLDQRINQRGRAQIRAESIIKKIKEKSKRSGSTKS